MDDNDHVLRVPRDRRKVLFEKRGEVGVYIENHPDEFARGHHPLVRIYNDAPIGVIQPTASKK